MTVRSTVDDVHPRARPSSSTATGELTATCGPLDVRVVVDCSWLRDKLARELELLDVAWPTPLIAISVSVNVGLPAPRAARASYLACARMHVERREEHVLATCVSGVWCETQLGSNSWIVGVPDRGRDPWVHTDIEGVLQLVWTTHWRALGWAPLHAAGVVHGQTCALLCASSGGGKSTLTAALMARGVRALGDDKLLLRCDDPDGPQVRALAHTFNLHARTQVAVPALAGIEELPVYSTWTDKRKVAMAQVWPQRLAFESRPTHVVALGRSERAGVHIDALDTGGVFSALVRQIVVPTDRGVARALLDTVSRVATRTTGLRVTVGDDALCDVAAVDTVLAALTRTRGEVTA